MLDVGRSWYRALREPCLGKASNPVDQSRAVVSPQILVVDLVVPVNPNVGMTEQTENTDN